ncbi:MAG: choice-of-anchor B family protein [Longimicrobiales bacterium]
MKTERINVVLTSALMALALSAVDARAQDQFGQAVAIADDGTVLVIKPIPGRGPASLHIYRATTDGEWSLAETVTPSGTADSGAGLSSSIGFGGGTLLVGSGDPEVVIGAHAFTASGGSWAETGALPLREAPAAPAGDGPAIDFGGILAILQPPPRVVTGGHKWAAVAVPRATSDAGAQVYVFRQSDAEWSHFTTIPRPTGNTDERFGAALLLTGDELLVSSPSVDGAGVVYRYALDETGQDEDRWSTLGTVAVDSLGDSSRFGDVMALSGTRLLVGAPTANASVGRAFLFELTEGDATLTQTFAPPSDDGIQHFGTAVSLNGSEIVVGAPGTEAGAGAAYVFSEGASGWSRAALNPGEALTRGSGFGTSVALKDGVLVAGAPGASGGNGRAVIFEPTDDTWTATAWLQPDVDLQAQLDGEVTCEDGEAAGFGCDGVDLQAYLPLSAIGAAPGERVSDVWGWTDPVTGREYALVGRTAGAAFVDVTDPSRPTYMGLVPANPSGARDLKVYADHLFFTGDGAGQHGLVIFDLTRLRSAGPGVEEFAADTVYDGFWSAHNLVMDTESGFAYPVGASGGGQTCGGGLHAVDVRDPQQPVFAGCFTDTEGLIWQGRTHDAQCTVYQGPDLEHQGRQLCFASNETALRIIDVTDKEAPSAIGTATYPGLAYVHQGWLTDDHRYYYLNDELDELVGTTQNTRTFVFNVEELDDPILVGSVDGPNGATDHNLYVKGDRMYQANYQAGFRLYDISDPEAPEEIGWFDTTPYEGNPPGFVGAWTAFPYLESGTVLVSSMHEGLFLLKPQRRDLIP